MPANDKGKSPKSSLLSIIVPIYCEEETVVQFHARTAAVLDQLSPEMDGEVVYVNDGSTDRSLSLLSNLAEEDPRVRVLDLSRNFGHQIAITAGMDHARGDAVVIIDGDLQDPPEVILEMVSRWREGFHVVYAARKQRKGESAFKKLTAKAYYRLIQRLSDTQMPVDTGDFRLMDRVVVDALRAIREENRYIRGLVSWVGFRQCAVYYQRDARYAGVTKFSVKKMFKFALDGITSFSDRPLRVSAHLGFLVTFTAFLMALWVLWGRITNPGSVVPGWTSLLVVMLFLGGVQLVCVGILGQYVGRIYRETKRRPLYFVAREYRQEGQGETQ